MNKLKLEIYKNINIAIVYLMQLLNIQHLKIIEKYNNEMIENSRKYESLIPNDNADEDNEYSKMLKVALETNNINNIAVTGIYGSGKSSILRTFEKKNSEWNYLNISLATFDEMLLNTSDEQLNESNEKNNQHLEKSIIQQIFYKERNKNIPFSKFKRISNISKKSIFINSVFIGLLILYGASIFSPKIKDYFGFSFRFFIEQNSSFIQYFVFFVGCFYFYKIFEYLTKLQASRFNIKIGEIEVNNGDKKSILNEHLDEVLYFFETTSYNVVVIEDLDRFNNTEIFIKLRELNTLINNSKDINRRVRFIYAIKDDMFHNKDRTKFFDFIVPIIPFINSSSSFEKIKEKFEEDNLNEDFLRDISLRINDMRLLINIANEYKIYKYKIKSEKLNKERLLAMIIYKNFYPLDFAELHINKGNVYEIFNNRIKFINEEIEKNKKIVLEKEKKIKEIESKIKLEKNKSILELRMIYLLKIFEKVNRNYFYILNNQYLLSNINNLVTDDIFKTIKIGEIKSDEYNRVITTFKKIEDEINLESSYDERENFIVDEVNEEIEQLKKDLEILKLEENKIKKFTVGEIAKIENSNILRNIEDKNLLKFLIRDEWIRKDYYDYISYFFEGSLTLKDRDFVLSVKDDKSLEFEYQLSNIKEVIIHLTLKEFESKAILNYSLLDYMLEHNIKDEKFEHFMINIINESNISQEFILSFIMITQNQKAFIEEIMKKWIKIWFYIYKESNLTEEKKDKYFKIFFEVLSINDLIKLNIENSIKYFIESKQSLLFNDTNKKFQELIKKIGVKYKYLENPVEENPTLFEFIYKNNLYQLNEKMINKIVFIKGEPKETAEEKLKISHYTTTQESEAKELKSYIKQNINEYVENVFLKIDTNTKENEEYIIELLNNEDLDDIYKEKIIQKIETKISDISQIGNKELWKILFEQNRINAIWNNILHYYKYNEEVFDKIIIDFMSIDENYKNLSTHKMNNEKDFEKSFLQKLSENIMKNSEIKDEVYSYIIKGIWFVKFPNFEIKNLTHKKIATLIENIKLDLTQANINNLKEFFPNKQIVLIENFKEVFLEKYNEFTLDENDYIEILKSSKFTIDEKLIIITNLDLTIVDNEHLAKVVTDIYLNNSIEISNEVFFKLFNKANFDDGLKLLINQIPKLEDEKISELLNEFENPYNELTEKSAKPLKFDKTEINEDLLMALNKKGFIGKVDKEKKEIIVNRKRV